MRLIVVALLGLAAGLATGLVLSEIIGIVGYLAFDRVVGIKFLPLMLGAVFAVVAPGWDRHLRTGVGR